jgi:hypothetical protein
MPRKSNDYRHAVWEVLQDGAWHSALDLVQVGGLRFAARIHELRRVPLDVRLRALVCRHVQPAALRVDRSLPDDPGPARCSRRWPGRASPPSRAAPALPRCSVNGAETNTRRLTYLPTYEERLRAPAAAPETKTENHSAGSGGATRRWSRSSRGSARPERVEVNCERDRGHQGPLRAVRLWSARLLRAARGDAGAA